MTPERLKQIKGFLRGLDGKSLTRPQVAMVQGMGLEMAREIERLEKRQIPEAMLGTVFEGKGYKGKDRV